MKFDISKMKKTEVLRALYNAAKPQGMGFLHYTPEPMTEEEAEALLAKGDYFDYVKGRVMKVSLRDNTLDTDLYDRDNGYGAGGRALNEALLLKCTDNVAQFEAKSNKKHVA